MTHSLTKAPDFCLYDQEEKQHKLSDYSKGHVLVYFYPKDDTPGCTTEACGIRDLYGGFERRGIKILGISADSSKSHKDFIEKYHLPFTLLSDQEGKVAQQYYAQEGVFFKRISYLISPGLGVLKQYSIVNPSQHAQEVLDDFDKLRLRLNCYTKASMKFLQNRKLIFTILAVFFLAGPITDILISTGISIAAKQKISVSGIDINPFKILSPQRELQLGRLSFGEKDSKINLKKLSISEIKKNPNNPDSCFDAKAKFKNIYLGGRNRGKCPGSFQLKCVPYNNPEKINIAIKPIEVLIDDGKLSGSTKIKTTTNNNLDINLNAILTKTNLKKLSKCANFKDDSQNTVIEVTSFNLNMPIKEGQKEPVFNGRGHFNLYQEGNGMSTKLKRIISKLGIKNKTIDSALADSKLRSDFKLKSDRMIFENLAYDSSVFRVVGNGVMNYDSKIDFKLSIQTFEKLIPAKTLKIDKLLPGGLIPLKVSGSTEKPEVTTNFSGIAKSITPQGVKDTISNTKKLLGLKSND